MSDRLNTSPDCLDLPAVSYPDYSSRSTKCFGAGDRHLYVDTDGVVHPCPFCRCPAGDALDDGVGQARSAMQARGCPATEEVHNG
jgi:MoaA/NifB/PqqE/SkfB family radical SAM enzyme